MEPIAQQKRRKPLSLKEYREKYAAVIDEARKADTEQPNAKNSSLSRILEGLIGKRPQKVPWNALRESWIADQLRKMADANEIEVFKLLLLELLYGIDVRVPRGILTPWPGTLGAPTKDQTKAIYDLWIELGEPPPNKNTLARAFYRTRYTTAAPADRKKMIDRLPASR